MTKDNDPAKKATTLLDLRNQVAATMTGTTRRDTLSALNALAKAAKVDLGSILATPPAVRTLLTARSAAQLNLSEKRYANICSLVRAAVRMFGGRPVSAPRVLDAEWAELLDRIPRREYRWSLSRLASFASNQGVRPAEVTRETLLAFYQHLEADEIIKKPRGLLKHTIALWNASRKITAGWPALDLASPFDSTAYTLRLDAFPASFQADVAEWRRAVERPDPFDDVAPSRPLKAVSAERNERCMRRLASLLIAAGAINLEDVTELSVLVTPDRVKASLRLLRDRRNGSLPADGSMPADIHRHAVVARAVARFHVRDTGANLRALDKLCERAAPPKTYGIRPRNRERLRQFDDPNKVMTFARLPELQRRRALKLDNPYRRAKGIERAVILAVLLDTALRIKNLSGLHLDRDMHWVGKRCLISIDGSQVKNGLPIEGELTPDTCKLLREYLDRYWPVLNAAGSGRYLFPGKNGGPASIHTIRHDITSVCKWAGLDMHPHLFRHAKGKIVLEREPDLAIAMSQHFAHGSVRTTLNAYLGTETRAASRRINAVLDGHKKGTAA